MYFGPNTCMTRPLVSGTEPSQTKPMVALNINTDGAVIGSEMKAMISTARAM